MKQFSPVAAVLMLWLWTAQPVSAQSTLKRLEELIRSNRSGAAAEPRPADAQPVVSAIRRPQAKSTSAKGYLGVVADDGQDRGRGVRVLQVRPASPADIAGLRPQDLITSAGGVRVRQMNDLADVLDQAGPGDVLEFEVSREQGPRKIAVTFGPLPAPKPDSFEEVLTPPPEPRAETPRVDTRERAPWATLPELPRPPQDESAASQPDGGPSKDAPQDDRALLESLRRRIQELERRVEQLERELDRMNRRS